MVNIVLAEDEEILRVGLQNKLTNYWPDAKIEAAVESGAEALSAIEQYKPDIAFLDIQMGDITGIQVSQRLQHQCHIVFVTAFNQYAIEAFDSGAIDYLLKPYSDDRLVKCIERLKLRLQNSPLDLQNLLRNFNPSGKAYLKRLKVQIGNKIWLTPVENIICLKANGRYVKVITREREGLIRMPLKSLLESLDGESFWQIHRSTIINIKHLDYVRNSEGEQMLAFMKHLSEPIQVSRAYSFQFRYINSF